MASRLLVLVVVVFITAQVVRNSAVAAFVERDPDAAARVWPSHPATEISLGMSKIGRAARKGTPVPAGIFTMMDDASRKAPLAPEPFFVRGVQARRAGNAGLAIDAFAAAARRNPRSFSAHYFLADALLRSGDAHRGLREIGILARIAPAGVAGLAPYIAAYAKNPQTWSQLREQLRLDPALQEPVLSALATDPANVDRVLALADQRRRGSKSPWLPTLLNSLVAAGQYDKAHQTWTALSHAQSAQGAVYDGDFVEANAPAPFNWMLTSSNIGLTERVPRGGLHVIFYGRENGLLARQLLVLSPGVYRMSMVVRGNAHNAHALTWSLRCDGSQTPVAAVSLEVAGSRSGSFAVSAGCRAQWLELSGVSTDVEHPSEVTIRNLRLVSERRHG